MLSLCISSSEHLCLLQETLLLGSCVGATPLGGRGKAQLVGLRGCCRAAAATAASRASSVSRLAQSSGLCGAVQRRLCPHRLLCAWLRVVQGRSQMTVLVRGAVQALSCRRDTVLVRKCKGPGTACLRGRPHVCCSYRCLRFMDGDGE